MDTKTNGNIVGIGMWEEAFAETWIIVKDCNGSDIQVTTDDLLESQPKQKNHRYVKVFYDNQVWWIHKNNHFPI